MGAMGAISVRPSHPLHPDCTRCTRRSARREITRAPGAHALARPPSGASKAARRSLPCSRFELRPGCPPRCPLAVDRLEGDRAERIHVGRAIGGRVLRPRRQLRADCSTSAAEMPKPVMRAASADSTMSRMCSKPWCTPRIGGVIDGALRATRRAPRPRGPASVRARAARRRANRRPRTPARDTRRRARVPRAIGAAMFG